MKTGKPSGREPQQQQQHEASTTSPQHNHKTGQGRRKDTAHHVRTATTKRHNTTQQQHEKPAWKIWCTGDGRMGGTCKFKKKEGQQHENKQPQGRVVPRSGKIQQGSTKGRRGHWRRNIGPDGLDPALHNALACLWDLLVGAEHLHWAIIQLTITLVFGLWGWWRSACEPTQ